MNIYKLESYVWVNLDDPESPDYDEENINKVQYDFSYGAEALEQAVADGIDFMNEHFDEWEFKSVSCVCENVINWPESNEEEDEHWKGDCKCPYEEFNSAVLDQRLRFDCICGNKIEVADNKWAEIKCLSCGNWIKREELTREKGILVYKKSEGIEKEE